MTSDISFTDHPSAAANPDSYETVLVKVSKAVKSFQLSLFSHEILHKDGSLRADEDLPEKEALKRKAVRDKVAAGEALTRPVAGIGVNDNFELGAGRDVFMTLAVDGWSEIPVHIRKAQRKDLEKFILT